MIADSDHTDPSTTIRSRLKKIHIMPCCISTGNGLHADTDYTNALEDINKTISLKPDMTIAYFARAVSAAKKWKWMQWLNKKTD